MLSTEMPEIMHFGDIRSHEDLQRQIVFAASAINNYN
jgi:hypothetical protein